MQSPSLPPHTHRVSSKRRSDPVKGARNMDARTEAAPTMA